MTTKCFSDYISDHNFSADALSEHFQIAPYAGFLGGQVQADVVHLDDECDGTVHEHGDHQSPDDQDAQIVRWGQRSTAAGASAATVSAACGLHVELLDGVERVHPAICPESAGAANFVRG